MLDALRAVRDELSVLPPPIIVFNKSHSGSRLLGRLIEADGVFFGAHQNESSDSLDLLRLVEHLVVHHYPGFDRLWLPGHDGDPGLVPLIRSVFSAHLESYDRTSGDRWGWKLCETLHILPVLDFLFPDARYLHLVRDGRDVAFCDHIPPNTPFRQKLYFNTTGLAGWRGLRFTRADYERRSHIFNALHWANSVTIGRAYASMLRERCLEVRYEALCRDFEGTGTQVLRFIGSPAPEATLLKLGPQVYESSVGKHRKRSWWKRWQVQRWIAPTLASFNYTDDTSLTPPAAPGNGTASPVPPSPRPPAANHSIPDAPARAVPAPATPTPPPHPRPTPFPPPASPAG